jgi:hypothetical protein
MWLANDMLDDHGTTTFQALRFCGYHVVPAQSWPGMRNHFGTCALFAPKAEDGLHSDLDTASTLA